MRNMLSYPSWKPVVSIWLQTAVCWCVLLPLGSFLIFLMKYVKGYEVENLTEIRRQFKKIWRQKKTPVIICANHLTFIDSALIIWALGSIFWYAQNYRAFTWNLPAGDFFKKKIRYRLALYLTKCIFLHRNGSPIHKNAVLNLCRYLLLKGNIVLIFPEGRRSRSGVFDEKRLCLGVGKIITSLENVQVLCVYLRSPQQQTFSNYPPKHSCFKLKMKMVAPSVIEASKKQASIAIVREIGVTIKNLENEFFVEARQSKSCLVHITSQP